MQLFNSQLRLINKKQLKHTDMRQIFNSILLMMLSLFSWINVEASTPIYEDIIENKVITRTYKVYDFNAIKSSAVCNIVFVQTSDGSSSLKIKGPAELISKIGVEVKEGVLCIEDNRRKNNKDKIEVEIIAPDLNAITSDGVGNILIKNGLKTNTLNINSQGVGNIVIYNLECSDLSASLDGVGNIELAGESVKALFQLGGVGSIKALNLKAQDVKASSSGVGNLSCYATKALDISLQGMGSISYKGNPTITNFEKYGWGKIKKIK